jgi:hypothetical protein
MDTAMAIIIIVMLIITPVTATSPRRVAGTGTNIARSDGRLAAASWSGRFGIVLGK